MAPITLANKSKAILAGSSDDNRTEVAVNEPHSLQAVDSTYSELMEQFHSSVMDKWRKKIDAEVQKRQGLEARLKELQDRCKFYAQRELELEEALKECEEEKLSAPVAAVGRVDEEVQSKLNPVDCDPLCRVCKNQKASIVLLPCRDLSVCMSCDRHVSRCPICDVKRDDSFRASWDGKPYWVSRGL